MNDIWKAEQAIWNAAAEALGWKWVSAYGGYVRSNHTKPGTDGRQWDDYPSEVDGEEACFIDGIETLDQAKSLVVGTVDF